MEHFSEQDRARIISLEGAYNVRDLGGIKTAGGGTVKRGLVFRSDELGGLTPGDSSQLGALGIKTVVDFRSDDEARRAAPNPLKSVREVRMGLDCGNMEAVLGEVNEKTGPELMKKVNSLLVREGVVIFREFFSLLERGENVPLLFHCAAGKDRTGFASAIFLSSLGVAEGNIFHDYMLSVQGSRRKFGWLVEREPRFSSVVFVRPEYLGAAFDTIKESYGSVEGYLTDELGVDLDKMRELYVKRPSAR